MKYSKLNLGIIEAVFNKLGGEEGAARFLRDEFVLTEKPYKWREHNGCIYFSVISDGTTGPEWVERLERKGYFITSRAKKILYSSSFKPTKDEITEIVVFKHTLYEKDNTTLLVPEIDGKRRVCFAPNAEVACLIREKFSSKEISKMGINRITIHHPTIKYRSTDDDQLRENDKVLTQLCISQTSIPSDYNVQVLGHDINDLKEKRFSDRTFPFYDLGFAFGLSDE